MTNGNDVSAFSASRIDEKKLLILMSILVVTFMVDSQIDILLISFLRDWLLTRE
jgi:hypothetical protein